MESRMMNYKTLERGLAAVADIAKNAIPHCGTPAQTKSGVGNS